jgi:hypothetical protein
MSGRRYSFARACSAVSRHCAEAADEHLCPKPVKSGAFASRDQNPKSLTTYNWEP